MFNQKNILITGGTGSFGKQMAKTLLERYKPNKVIKRPDKMNSTSTNWKVQAV